jgi:FkbH-like protein
MLPSGRPLLVCAGLRTLEVNMRTENDLSDPAPTPNAAVAIAATFTIEPVAPLLQFVLREAGMALDVRCAPYNQVFQELLSTTGLLATNKKGINIIIIRMEDFLRESPDNGTARTLLARTTRELNDAFTQFAGRATSPILLVVLDRSPSAPVALHSYLDEAAAAVIECAQILPDVHLVLPADITSVCTVEKYDPSRDTLAHIPFTEEFYGAMAYAIGRKAHALRNPSHKVLVLDCDNTLWRGVIGEDGVEGITLPDACLRVQRFAVELQTKGILLCLASSNIERDVLDVFKRKPGMALKTEHIISHRINWQPKSDNLSSLARELDLGLDSFVFLDDNPIECAKMRAALPQVVTLQLPPDDEIDSFLSRLWVFDQMAVSTEDTVRTALYRENAARQRHGDSSADLSAFVASLELQIDIASPQESEWPRVAQLTQRTNQFNFTTVRRSESELRTAHSSGSLILRVNVRDRFGDYGLVGLMVATCTDRALVVDMLLLSCRALGRGVEHAMLRRLGELSAERGLAYVDLPYEPTSRNEPARVFAESVAASFKTGDQRSICYRMPTAYACSIVHCPGKVPDAAIGPRKPEEATGIRANSHQVSASIAARSERYYRLALIFGTGSAIVNAVRAQSARVRLLSSPLEAPATDAEQRMASLWRELLNVDALGVKDDYFALGGTSLLAVRMLSAIERRFGVKLRLATIMEEPTVRALARHIARNGNERRGNLVELKPGCGQHLFLVHDGDGETLLYRNLARRLPDNLAVLGIEPHRIPNVPLAHTRIEDMAHFYIEEMRKKQPTGPYMIGGLCAGGVIAYEMASQLEIAGEHVRLLALLDAAKPRAVERPGRRAGQRVKRIKEMFADSAQSSASIVARICHLAAVCSRKLIGFVLWKLYSRTRHWGTQVRFRVLREVLHRGLPWPSFLGKLSVREIYESAEAQYVPRALTHAGVVLARAQCGENDDTPYREIFADDSFGWKSLTAGMDVIDVKGGHSSMLQEPFVESLAVALIRRVKHDLEPYVANIVSDASMQEFFLSNKGLDGRARYFGRSFTASAAGHMPPNAGS